MAFSMQCYYHLLRKITRLRFRLKLCWTIIAAIRMECDEGVKRKAYDFDGESL